MSKNIIVCCDGTANQFGETNSNVVKLFTTLERSEGQVIYYDPGVGTLTEKEMKTSLGKKWSIFKGMAFGLGLKENLFEAYEFLMNNYEKGDRIFLFGFSRGAYTVRVLAALIHQCGLLPKGMTNLLDYAFLIYSGRKFELGFRFRQIYSQIVRIHFVGVWDTVPSYGWIGNWRNYPYTAKNPNILNVRHAISIDEKRTYYKQNLFNSVDVHKSDIKQVWFAGVHSDVGGSYPELESGLSKISLKWMIVEAVSKCLLVNRSDFDEIVLGHDKDYVPPDFNAIVHSSLSGAWWIFEFFPRSFYYKDRDKNVLRIPLGTRRYIEEDSTLHQSVVERVKNGNYNPTNLPSKFKVERDLDLA